MSRIAILPNGRIAVAGSDGQIGIWGPFSGERFGNLPRPRRASAHWPVLAALPDGRLAVGEADGTIGLWHVGRRQETARLHGSGAAVTSLVVHASGTLIGGDTCGRIIVWDMGSGRLDEIFGTEHRGPVDALMLEGSDGLMSLDGGSRRLLSYYIWGGHYDGATPLGPSPVLAVAPVGEGWVAAACADRRIRLADIYGGRGTRPLASHDWTVTALCGIDACRMASGGSDGMIRFWDVIDDCEVACLELGFVPIALALHPDGRLLVAQTGGQLTVLPFTLPAIE